MIYKHSCNLPRLSINRDVQNAVRLAKLTARANCLHEWKLEGVYYGWPYYVCEKCGSDRFDQRRS